jgi:hypothetical protein
VFAKAKVASTVGGVMVAFLGSVASIAAGVMVVKGIAVATGATVATGGAALILVGAVAFGVGVAITYKGVVETAAAVKETKHAWKAPKYREVWRLLKQAESVSELRAVGLGDQQVGYIKGTEANEAGKITKMPPDLHFEIGELKDIGELTAPPSPTGQDQPPSRGR